MARSGKYNKNLSKVQEMLDGTYQDKIQVSMAGDTSVNTNRKVGDIWIDSDGTKWEQKQGYRSKISNIPDVGIFDKVCKDCETPCLKKFDKDTHDRM